MKQLWNGLVSSLTLVLLSWSPAKALDIQIIADNDFALFSGTSTSVNTLLFQNHFNWSDQLAAQSSPLPSVPAGDTHFYLLAMGGGAPEEVMGTIDGVNITTIADAMVSDDFSASLSGFTLNSVEDGIYNVALSDVQAVFPTLNFQAPTVGCNYVCKWHYGAAATNQSFLVGTGAQLFAFKVPGPLPAAGLVAALHASRKIRQRIQLSCR
jgi:hypothetical protein